MQVSQTGLWLDESGVLGASPDGLIVEDCVLEVKCPFTRRDKPLEDALQDKPFYLVKSQNGISLRKDHTY